MAAAAREHKPDAEALLRAGRLQEAAAVLQEDIRANPADPVLLTRLGRLLLALGRADEAGGVLDKALALRPVEPAAQAAALSARGAVWEAGGALARALPLYEQAVAKAPDLFVARFNLGRALAQEGRHDEAAPHLERAVDLDPARVEAAYALGICRRERGDLGGSIKAFTKTIERNPGFQDGYLTLADVLSEAGHLPGAEKVLTQGISVLPERAIGPLLDKLAAVYVKQGAVEQAVRTLERQTGVEPQNARAWLNLSTFAQMRGDLQRAEHAAKAVLERDPDHWEALDHLANVYEAAGLADEAEATWRRSLEHAPAEAWRPRTNLGYLLCSRRGDQAAVAEGIPLLEAAHAHAPESEPSPRWNLALAYLDQGRIEEGVDLLRVLDASLPADHRLRPEIARALAAAERQSD